MRQGLAVVGLIRAAQLKGRAAHATRPRPAERPALELWSTGSRPPLPNFPGRSFDEQLGVQQDSRGKIREPIEG